MPDNPISYDVDADNKFKKAMARAVASGLDLSFSMGEAARIIKKDAGKNFILKGSGQYPPLSDTYFARKQKLAPGTPILTGLTKTGKASGKLKRSIVGTTADSIIRVGKTSLDVGTKVLSKKGAPYPIFVQEGTENKDGSEKMPERKFLFFTQRIVKQISNTINSDIANQLPN